MSLYSKYLDELAEINEKWRQKLIDAIDYIEKQGVLDDDEEFNECWNVVLNYLEEIIDLK